MKKLFGNFLWGIIAIPLCIFIFNTVIPFVYDFVAELIKIDNYDFGFSFWFDFTIDTIAGVVAYFFVKVIFYSCSKQDKKLIENIVSIVVGFAIGVITHFCIQYWKGILTIAGIVLIVAIICYIIKSINNHKKQKENSNGVLQHSSTNE